MVVRDRPGLTAFPATAVPKLAGGNPPLGGVERRVRPARKTNYEQISFERIDLPPPKKVVLRLARPGWGLAAPFRRQPYVLVAPSEKTAPEEDYAK